MSNNIAVLADAFNKLAKSHAKLRAGVKGAFANIQGRVDRIAEARKVEAMAEVALGEVASVIDEVRAQAEAKIARAIDDTKRTTRRKLDDDARKTLKTYRADSDGLTVATADGDMTLPWEFFLEIYNTFPSRERAIAAAIRHPHRIMCRDILTHFHGIFNGAGEPVEIVQYILEPGGKDNGETDEELRAAGLMRSASIPWNILSDAYGVYLDGNFRDRPLFDQAKRYSDFDGLSKNITATLRATPGVKEAVSEAKKLSREFEKEHEKEYGALPSKAVQAEFDKAWHAYLDDITSVCVIDTEARLQSDAADFG